MPVLAIDMGATAASRGFGRGAVRAFVRGSYGGDGMMMGGVVLGVVGGWLDGDGGWIADGSGRFGRVWFVTCIYGVLWLCVGVLGGGVWALVRWWVCYIQGSCYMDD